MSAEMEAFVKIIVDTVLHQFPGVTPLVGLVVGPAAGKQCHDKCPPVPLQRTHITVSRLVGKSCLHAHQARDRSPQRVCGEQAVAVPRNAGGPVAAAPGKQAEGAVLHGVCRDHGKVMCGGIMIFIPKRSSIEVENFARR